MDGLVIPLKVIRTLWLAAIVWPLNSPQLIVVPPGPPGLPQLPMVVVGLLVVSTTAPPV